MKPPVRKMDYEKINTDDFVSGFIEEIQYKQDHVFKYKGEERIAPAVRFKFMFEGYKYPHYSRWMSFNYGEKSNLYKKYLDSLVQGAKPDMDFDLDALKGMKVKTLWKDNGDFQNLETIRPVGSKLVPLAVAPQTKEDLADVEEPADEEAPF